MKRDTDTEKWKKQFFKRLTQEQMLFWIYINDDCDLSGVWYVDMEVANLRIKSNISIHDIVKVFNSDEERVYLFDNNKKLLIFGFIQFQYGINAVKDGKNRLHKKALEVLERHGFKYFNGVVTPSGRPEVQVQVVGKGTEGVIGGNENFDQLESFNKFWEIYPSRGRLRRSESLRIWCEIVVSRASVTRIQTALSRYSAHLKANGWKTPIEASRFLQEWPDWENHEEKDDERNEKSSLEKLRELREKRVPKNS